MFCHYLMSVRHWLVSWDLVLCCVILLVKLFLGHEKRFLFSIFLMSIWLFNPLGSGTLLLDQDFRRRGFSFFNSPWTTWLFLKHWRGLSGILSYNRCVWLSSTRSLGNNFFRFFLLWIIIWRFILEAFRDWLVFGHGGVPFFFLTRIASRIFLSSRGLLWHVIIRFSFSDLKRFYIINF